MIIILQFMLILLSLFFHHKKFLYLDILIHDIPIDFHLTTLMHL